eukprot:421169-Hanusia_phi.AAC.1
MARHSREEVEEAMAQKGGIENVRRGREERGQWTDRVEDMPEEGMLLEQESSSCLPRAKSLLRIHHL